MSKQIARESELRFAAELTRQGWDIFFPYGEDSSVDILAYKNGKYLKIQVKATKPKNGALSCKLRSTNNWQSKKYTKSDIDHFAFYDYVNKKGYLVPIGDIEGMSEIKIRIEPPKNKQKKGIRKAENYLYFK